MGNSHKINFNMGHIGKYVFQTWGHFLTTFSAFFLKKNATGKMDVFEGSFHIDYYIPDMSHIKMNCMGIPHRNLPRIFHINLSYATEWKS